MCIMHRETTLHTTSCVRLAQLKWPLRIYVPTLASLATPYKVNPDAFSTTITDAANIHARCACVCVCVYACVRVCVYSCVVLTSKQ